MMSPLRIDPIMPSAKRRSTVPRALISGESRTQTLQDISTPIPHQSREQKKTQRRYANLRNCTRRVFFFWNLGHALAVDDRRNLKGGKDRGDRDPHRRARHESSWTYPTTEPKAGVGRLHAGVEEPLRSESKRLGKHRLVVQHSPKLRGFAQLKSPGSSQLTTCFLLRCCPRGGSSLHIHHPQSGDEEPLAKDQLMGKDVGYCAPTGATGCHRITSSTSAETYGSDFSSPKSGSRPDPTTLSISVCALLCASG